MLGARLFIGQQVLLVSFWNWLTICCRCWVTSMAFFTDFKVRGYVGLLDWYTVSVAIFAVVLSAAPRRDLL